MDFKKSADTTNGETAKSVKSLIQLFEASEQGKTNVRGSSLLKLEDSKLVHHEELAMQKPEEKSSWDSDPIDPSFHLTTEDHELRETSEAMPTETTLIPKCPLEKDESDDGADQATNENADPANGESAKSVKSLVRVFEGFPSEQRDADGFLISESRGTESVYKTQFEQLIGFVRQRLILLSEGCDDILKKLEDENLELKENSSCGQFPVVPTIQDQKLYETPDAMPTKTTVIPKCELEKDVSNAGDVNDSSEGSNDARADNDSSDDGSRTSRSAVSFFESNL
ncbi:unnamed protein product [Caenorhabditis sp. 36 PRJEB53466]|nr:unnamed protein product [Caenorhabditis sp. 36 PRJEB53466]